ncbi:MAG: hypothetical protein HY820_20735 [Acidobacteria bacterium]|nr:hypothetical protein [Acidobacteriota bacterium]
MINATVRFETTRAAQPLEPSDHVLEIDGEILLLGEDEETTTAGTIGLFLVSLSTAVEAGFSALEVMDSHGETADFFDLYDDAGNWSDLVTKQFPDAFDSDLLIANRATVKPKYRGKGLGIMAVTTALDCFSRGCGLVVTKPFPLQFEGWQSPDWKPPQPLPRGMTKQRAFEAARKKLENYWARVGFRRIGKTEM